jgi:hypothetical protein
MKVIYIFLNKITLINGSSNAHFLPYNKYEII